jgi:SAM-dependent methyltransferase
MTGKETTELDVARIYKARFSPEERAKKEAIWRVLCSDFFQQYVKPDDTVLDVGAGYCEFINNIVCAHKIAVDINKDTALYAASDVHVLHHLSDDMKLIPDSSIDVAFVSNFFEHLPDKETFVRTIREIYRVLRTGGRILVLQPNIRFIPGEYWDFLDHHIPLTDRTIVEGLIVCGLRPVEVRPRFLPYTTKGLLPQHPLLVKIYLRIGLLHRIFGAQAWIVGIKD